MKFFLNVPNREEEKVKPLNSKKPVTPKRLDRFQTYAQVNPQLSTRQISLYLGVTKDTIRRILADNKFHPYHVSLHQALSYMDYNARLNFCNWLKQMYTENNKFLSRMLLTDEATFCNTGSVNLHNANYWSTENIDWLRRVDRQNRWKMNVRCGIVESKIIGPFVFNEYLNGDNYVSFLTNELNGLLENVPLETRRTMWFQQDGCPAHYSRNVRDHLDRTFSNRWIGRASLFPWPARSPDLTLSDFYLW
ncbi:hypothetical protein YQE_09910, partial [Dendroctonus ponderosae]